MLTLMLATLMTTTDKPAPRPVVIATDCGCSYDDEWGIAHLLLSTETVEVRGILTSHSPDIPADGSVAAVRRLLAHIPGGEKIPVVAGASGAMRDRATARPSRASAWLLEESRRYDAKRRLTVALLGPATDITAALLTDPTLADRVEVVAMGFVGWPAGGDPYNVKNDVAAWQVLLASRTPITVADESVTTRSLKLARKDLHKTFARRGHPGRFLADLTAGWIDENADLAKRLTGSAETAAVWDQGVAAAILGFAKVERRPRSRLRDDRTFEAVETEAKVDWVVEIDSGRLWEHLRAKLEGVADRAGMP